MRKSKIIKRRNVYFLSAVFFASAILFYEAHPNHFYRDFAEREVQRLLPGGVRVEMERIEGGILRKLVLENVRVSSGNEASGVNIERVEVDYRIWYQLLGNTAFSRYLKNKRKITLYLGDKEKDLKTAFFELDGTTEALDAVGYVTFGEKEKVSLKGSIKKEGLSRLSINFKKGELDLEIEKIADEFKIKGRMSHVSFCGTDLIGNLEATFNTALVNCVKAEIVFRDIIINYRPFTKIIRLSLDYESDQGVLNITKFKIGDEIEGYGNIRGSEEAHIFLKWTVRELMLEEYYSTEKASERISGKMNGNFILKGAVREPELSAHFDVQNGNFGDLKFDSAIGNLKGKGAVISVNDSRILRGDGHITVDGEIDLSKLKEKKAFDGILFNNENFFVWEGWSITKERDESSVKAEKPLDKDFNLSFEARSEDMNAEEERYVGIEHKVKF